MLIIQVIKTDHLTEKNFFTKELPKKVSEIHNVKFDENADDSDDLQREGVKIIIPSIKIDIYTRLEIFTRTKIIGTYRYSNRS